MTQLVCSPSASDLVLQSIAATLARVEAFSPEVRAQVSPVWLAMATSAKEASPWIHGFSIVERRNNQDIGSCGFKGPPDSEGVVELAYGIEPEFQLQGFATEAAQTLVTYALQQDEVQLVRAHTLLDNIASQRVLIKCGFRCLAKLSIPKMDSSCDGSYYPNLFLAERQGTQTNLPVHAQSGFHTASRADLGKSSTVTLARLVAGFEFGDDVSSAQQLHSLPLT